MSDEYLWDKSGEPDPEVERLEGLLGELRYRRPPTPLPLPQRAPVHSRRTFRPAYAAAAAALLCMAIVGGLWLGLGVRNESTTAGIAAINAQPGRAQDWLSSGSIALVAAQSATEEASQPAPALVRERGPRSSASKRREMPGKLAAIRRPPISDEEGVAAREQLIKALHLASSKLNLLQKKVQDNKSDGPNS